MRLLVTGGSGFLGGYVLSEAARRGHEMVALARSPAAAAVWTVQPQTVLSPREAFFAPNETVLASAAVGRISAELVAPYPPGVPVLAPGELITAEALAALREVAADGGRIAYAADPTLATFQVVAA